MRAGLVILPSLMAAWGLAVCSLAACASSEPAAPADPVAAEGRFLAEVHCSACHAIGRNDGSKHPEAPRLRDLSKHYPVAALEESLAEGIVVGHPDMPEFRFRPEDVAALIRYLETIQTQ
jgi:mono/diheme cytochrome c family protein